MRLGWGCLFHLTWTDATHRPLNCKIHLSITWLPHWLMPWLQRVCYRARGQMSRMTVLLVSTSTEQFSVVEMDKMVYFLPITFVFMLAVSFGSFLCSLYNFFIAACVCCVFSPGFDRFACLLYAFNLGFCVFRFSSKSKVYLHLRYTCRLGSNGRSSLFLLQTKTEV